ncbi:putative toxin-antitoxin system toxin component, PIN family [Luteolibacter sp. Populi]|uniref:putative toxin-antitoxin system toxin component, PIN family n=1 Tax=Luteolibacter sp. Populi TaxID=3230487 RepID=UPI0034654768
MRVVLDTCVLVSALRSNRGASFQLVSLIPHPSFQISLSVGLYTEWCDVISRPEHLPPGKTTPQAIAFLRYLASQAHLQNIHFLWRPCLKDPDDDMLLELAVAAGCPYIITHNIRDFANTKPFGIQALTPRDFLNLIAHQP